MVRMPKSRLLLHWEELLELRLIHYQISMYFFRLMVMATLWWSDRRNARSGFLASDVDPVPAFERYGPNGVLDQVVTQLQNYPLSDLSLSLLLTRKRNTSFCQTHLDEKPHAHFC